MVLISWRPGEEVVPVTISTSENSASVNADGLKMWTRRPSRSHRTNALPRKPDGDEQELEGEPVVPEPQEQVGAEDDREAARSRPKVLAARPRQQHVEGVGEEQLADEQRHVGVDRRPVPAPVGVDAQRGSTLDVVLRPRRRADEAAGGGPGLQGQHGLPREQDGGGTQNDQVSAALLCTRGRNDTAPAARG